MELVIGVCGDNGVGKGSIIKRFFGDAYRSGDTVQYKFVGSEKLVHVYVEKFRNTLSRPDGCIFVYDITSPRSFSTMCRKYREVGGMFRRNIVFGNKTDLDSKRAVARHEVQEWARRNRLKQLEGNHYEISSVNHVFYTLIQDILNVADDERFAAEFAKFLEEPKE